MAIIHLVQDGCSEYRKSNMFDSTPQKKGTINQPATRIPAGLESIEVHTIPSAFYNGAMGDGVAHSPEKDAPIIVKPPSPTSSAKPITAHTAPTPALQGIKPPPAPFVGKPIKSSKMVLVFAVAAIILLGGGGFSYYWLVYQPENKPKPVVIVPTQEEVLQEEIIPPPEPTETPTSTPEVIPPPKIYPKGLREFALSPDSDNDGLSDLEEQTLYKSDAQKPDADVDGYLDGHEVLNLYNPNGFKPVKLEDAGLVTHFPNTVFGYTLLYPATWQAGPLDQDGKEVLFTSTTGEYVSVKVYPNLADAELKSWYLSRVPQVTADKVTSFKTKQGLSGLMSPDGLSVYFGREKLVYEIRYDIGVRVDANFMRTFEMMQQSFLFTTKPAYIPKEDVEVTAPQEENTTSTLPGI